MTSKDTKCAGADAGTADKSQLKLTDLFDECLEHIFMYLGYDELLNVAEANKHLKTAANTVFIRKFSKKIFRLHHSFFESNNSIYVGGPKTSLQTLRCFGHLIPKLEVIGHEFGIGDLNYLLCYIMEFCSQSLVELSLQNISKGVFESAIIKPFPKIETVKITHCRDNGELPNLSAWFPAMRCLDFYDNKFSKWSAIENHFPHLEHFSIMKRDTYDPLKSIIEFLNLNSQLRTFAIDQINLPDYFFIDRIQIISTSLPNLNWYKLDSEIYNCNLHAISEGIKEMEFCDRQPYNLKPSSVSPCTRKAYIKSGSLIFDSNAFVWISCLADFLARHNSIKILTLLGPCRIEKTINATTLTEIVQKLPLLHDLNLIFIDFSMDELIDLIKKFNLVTYSFYLSLRSRKTIQLDNLETRLGDQWRTTIDGKCITVQRIA